MNIIMYTTHCPRCKVLAAKLAAKGVTYKEETNTETMLSMVLPPSRCFRWTAH